MPDPLVVRVVREFQRDLRNREMREVQAMARQWLTIENRLRDDITALATEIARRRAAGEVVTLGQLYQMERYQMLLAQIQQEIAKYVIYAERTIGTEQYALAQFGLVDAYAAVQAAMFDLLGILGVEFNQINFAAVENIVAVARAGQSLAIILERAYPITAQAINDILIQGTALGWNPVKTARLIMHDGLAQGLNHILLVARDQEIRAYREASRQGYERAGVQRYRRIAAHDDRVCAACIALDGTEYDTDELMELHPQDRCAMIPIIPGMQPSEYPTGQDWFDRQSAETQRTILGPGRYDAYRAGRFEFGDLAKETYSATWGPGLQVTPMSELVQ